MRGLSIRAAAPDAAIRREEAAARRKRLLESADFRAFLDELAFSGGFMRSRAAVAKSPYEAGRSDATCAIVQKFVRADGGLEWLKEFIDKLEKREKEERAKDDRR